MKNKLYNDLNSYLQTIFGKKVYKITIDSGLTCPNREKGLQCIYCNERGSGNGLYLQGISINQQIKIGIDALKKKYKKIDAFIAYFQSYSNTYADTETLKKNWDEIKNFPEIIGLSIGTRPDCVNEQNLHLLQTYTDQYKVFLEIGLQSVKDETLKWMNRGHSLKEFESCLKLCENYNFDIVIHVIIGFPYETRQDVINMAKYLSNFKIDGVKIHLLYVAKSAPLREIYEKGEYIPIEMNDYVNKVCDFLEYIPQNVVIHRLTGDAHKGELIAPLWSANKTETLLNIKKELETRCSFQGAKCK